MLGGQTAKHYKSPIIVMQCIRYCVLPSKDSSPSIVSVLVLVVLSSVLVLVVLSSVFVMVSVLLVVVLSLEPKESTCTCGHHMYSG